MFNYNEEKIIAEVYNEGAFNQKLLFSGMVYLRNISPTDIEIFIDFGGKLFVYGEAKKAPYKLTKGQKSALEHQVNSHLKANNVAIAFYFQHNVLYPEPILAKDQLVTEVYWDRVWRPTIKPMTVHELINEVIKWCINNDITI